MVGSPPVRAASPSSVLFLCNRNAIRSPMAEWLLKQRMGRRLYVDSVGLVPGELDPFVLSVMAEIGLDLGGHRVKTVEDVDVSGFDLLLSLAPEAHETALRLTRASACEVDYWDVADPSETEGSRDTRLAAYRALRDDLGRRIVRRFALN